MRVLIIEDDETLADVLERGLTEAGHETTVRRTGPEGLAAAIRDDHDAVVLDWMLPGQDGPSVCRDLRAIGNDTPVLMLTARHAVPDRVGGLDSGADDYLTKPFAFDELLARLRVFERRSGGTGLLIVDDLIIDHESRTVTRADVPVNLTAREFDLLVMLAERTNRVVTRVQILDQVWGGEPGLRSNAIDVHVGNLRAKIDRAFGRDTVQTVRGLGFRLASNPEGRS